MNNIKELVYYTVAFLQITEQQVVCLPPSPFDMQRYVMASLATVV